ncbi:MAG: beta-ketoacyl-[acyl-carrier-protein] synthase family protein [Candidatus Omnitrophica bacterium]|nr:beta-ketoacyl-[acyl-carrier-protein] synthase family protein [Candidatus Omnitrophota bacterium]
MNAKQVVVTGIGVISPNGTGKEAFWKALNAGQSGIKPITLFDVSFFKTKTAGECTDFKAEDFLGTKGLRNLDRTTTLLCSGVKLALDDANLQITDENADDIGVVTATTLSITSDLAKFTKEQVDEGAQLVNPALFPPTTMNFPSSQLSIRFKARAFNTTISTGYTAGLDALKYAIDLIRLGRAQIVLVCGIESFSFSNFTGFYKIGFLAGLKGPEISCPYDKRHNGIVLGEGTTTLVIENKEYAQKRKANILAEILSVENSFDAYKTGKYAPKAEGLIQSMTRAIENAELNTEEIDYICASANSVPVQDTLETEAIKKVFKLYSKSIPVSSIKSMIGESVSANGGLQIAASIGALKNAVIPPTINFEGNASGCDLDYVPNSARHESLNNILINNFGPGGGNASAIIAKYEE